MAAIADIILYEVGVSKKLPRAAVRMDGGDRNNWGIISTWEYYYSHGHVYRHETHTDGEIVIETTVSWRFTVDRGDLKDALRYIFPTWENPHCDY